MLNSVISAITISLIVLHCALLSSTASLITPAILNMVYNYQNNEDILIARNFTLHTASATVHYLSLNSTGYSFYRATAKHTHGIALEILSVCRPFVIRVYCDKTKAPSEKSSIMTNSKSPTSFPMSLRWTSYVAPNPQRGPQKPKFDQ